jgi:hypothetical protein
MKKIFIVAILFFLSNYCFSQDTVYVEGMFVQKFLKSEIIFKIHNEALQQQGKSFQQIIDYKVQSFYYTIKINSFVLQNEHDIELMVYSNPNYKNIEIYKFLNYDGKVRLNDSNYFVNLQDSNYVYKIYSIKGNALRYKVENDYFNKKRNIDLEVKWEIDSFNVNRNIPCFYLYLFYKYDIFDYNVLPKGFAVWNRTNML